MERDPNSKTFENRPTQPFSAHCAWNMMTSTNEAKKHADKHRDVMIFLYIHKYVYISTFIHLYVCV